MTKEIIRYPQKMIDRIKERIAAGERSYVISRETGIPVASIQNWVRLDTTMPRRPRGRPPGAKNLVPKAQEAKAAEPAKKKAKPKKKAKHQAREAAPTARQADIAISTDPAIARELAKIARSIESLEAAILSLPVARQDAPASLIGEDPPVMGELVS